MLCASYIHFEPMKLRTTAEIVKAYTTGTDLFESKCIAQTYEPLDNETSKQLESYCLPHQPQLNIQYVPPHEHRANRAERALRGSVLLTSHSLWKLGTYYFRKRN